MSSRSPFPVPRSPVEHLYIHVPFCARRCTYCDFSIAVRAITPVTEYAEALARELAGAERAGPLRTLYLGGGTPSRLGGEGIARVAALAGAGQGLDEFTIEANPEDVTPEVARAWVRAGVNRLSLGSQSFDDRVLAWMHRTHDAAAIGRAVRVARDAGIANLSLDLIFSLPESLGRDWNADLARTVALEPDHISLYGLTVEAGTPLAKQILRGQSAAAPDTRYADEYLRAHEVLGAAGYAFYEVSNAARPGREAIHNRAYWRRVPYLGVGPSAHSFDGAAHRWWNEPAYAKWVSLLETGASPVAGEEALTAEQVRMEEVYLGLRTTDGLTLRQDDSAQLLQQATAWARAGWAEVESPEGFAKGGHEGRPCTIRLTPAGWLRLDELVASV